MGSGRRVIITPLRGLQVGDPRCLNRFLYGILTHMIDDRRQEEGYQAESRPDHFPYEVVNPSYKVWYRQDNLIRNALMASNDPPLAPSIAAVTTSKQAWDQLHTTFANKSQMRIYSLRGLLGKFSRDSKMISKYLREIRSLANELASVASPISNEELIVKILSGLGPEFHEINAAIRARDTPISYEELFDKLLDYELFLKHEEIKKHPTPIMAQVAQRTGSNNSNNHSNQ
ncbi:hypothetical protein RJ640_012418 [Escallonia rubra]|uniref:UBN2 domain-containing protein n=1 Tax=Escallonia rubra TaxID=112253 RepID=A0AA88QP76_9ASTE|nr:hypothetical protein RJ640_012418 [Escallonia rubra]